MVIVETGAFCRWQLDEKDVNQNRFFCLLTLATLQDNDILYAEMNFKVR